MPWRRMVLRKSTVLAHCDASGEPLVENGRVEIRYRPDGRPYPAAARNLRPASDSTLLPEEHCVPGSAVPAEEGPKKGGAKTKAKKAKRRGSTAVAREQAARTRAAETWINLDKTAALYEFLAQVRAA